MFRQLPSRWLPALNLWNRGEPVEDIAAAYSMTTTAMNAAIGALREKYRGSFAPRDGTVATVPVTRIVVPVPSLRDRVNTALAGRRFRSFRPFPRGSGRLGRAR